MPVDKGVTLDPARTREQILQVATEVLYEQGLDGVGVAGLCTRAGVSKETLYRHFGSKEGLVRATLEARSDRVTRWLREAAEAAGPEPADQLGAVFDALTGWYAEPGFRGCAIVNAAVQHHEGAARQVAARHMDRHLELLSEIAARAGAAEPGVLARQILVLMEGAAVVADLHGVDGTGRQVREAALALLRASAARASAG
ncbi:TetR/AcrR family transcriptional regulator [Nonomuraea roseoviolacea]|uniref:AcrR family transcriptional regulator n=1 Tax=Nonomuraea roseoviolacea subsp. carminata TaxID=160689 RepID=A0ABT1KDX2_9ACTN|nr:TetR/AcrR family transcriptional regulator [Nonomuraea roseoviolacea]MCP2352165.1 AcrR family transcriptional regulator [Nonomuraea roseoviolacea subsp. carminata]